MYLYLSYTIHYQCTKCFFQFLLTVLSFSLITLDICFASFHLCGLIIEQYEMTLSTSIQLIYLFGNISQLIKITETPSVVYKNLVFPQILVVIDINTVCDWWDVLSGYHLCFWSDNRSRAPAKRNHFHN